MKHKTLEWGMYVVSAVLVLVAAQFMYVLPIHIAAFVVAVVGIVAADGHAAWWVVKRNIYLPTKRLVYLHQIILGALVVSITSGLIMLWPVREFLLYELSFQIKLAFVLALVMNSFFIGQHMLLPGSRTFGELTVRERWPLFISGAVSTVAWVGTVIAALSLPL